MIIMIMIMMIIIIIIIIIRKTQMCAHTTISAEL
jgi:hypothetical protein